MRSDADLHNKYTAFPTAKHAGNGVMHTGIALISIGIDPIQIDIRPFSVGIALIPVGIGSKSTGIAPFPIDFGPFSVGIALIQVGNVLNLTGIGLIPMCIVSIPIDFGSTQAADGPLLANDFQLSAFFPVKQTYSAIGCTLMVDRPASSVAT